MRRVFLMFAVLLGFGASSMAEEMVRVPFVNDVFSIEMPGDWDVAQDEDGIVVVKPENSYSQIIIAPPNPHIEGEMSEYVNVIVAGMGKTFGDLQIINEMEDTVDGNPAFAAVFTFESQGVEITGVVSAIDFDGWALLAVIFGPSEEMGEFLPVAAEVMESLEVDSDAIEENAELLSDLGEKALASLLEMFGE